MTGAPRPAARGFTLVEVLIAVAITAGIGAMLIGTLAQVDRAGDLARAEGERYGAARVALTRISRELESAYVSDRYDHSQYQERPTLFVGREDRIAFTSFAHERLYADAKESDEAIFAYALDRDPDHGGDQALFRREKVRIDGDPEHGGRSDPVLEGVTGLRLAYWDPKRKEWVKEWSTRAVDHASDLPTRVRIELELTMPDGKPRRFTTQARLALTRALPDA